MNLMKLRGTPRVTLTAFECLPTFLGTIDCNVESLLKDVFSEI